MGDLAHRLRREGLLVGAGVGTGRRRIDLAVTDAAHEGRWLVAVEGDGPEYASWYGTRERDRLWPQALERRGWRHLRVWSTDLYRDPAREVARVVAAVREAARAHPGAGDDRVAPTEDDDRAEVSSPSESGMEDPGREPDADPPHSDEGSVAEAAPVEFEAGEAEVPGPDAPAPDAPGRPRRRGFRRAGRPTGRPDEPGGSSSPAGGEPDRTAQTRDDTDAGWGERQPESEHDRWLREQRPPHWE